MNAGFAAPRKIAALLAGYAHPWAVAGGWGIDLFLGQETREHKDVDVAVFRNDQGAIRSYLSARGWTLEKAHDGKLVPWAMDELLQPPIHVVWCRNGGHDPDFLEILFEEATQSDLLFRRDTTVAIRLDRAFVRSASGLPIVAPEIALLYKASHHGEDGNAADFRSALPCLDAARRAWLREVLARVHPGHIWLAAL